LRSNIGENLPVKETIGEALGKPLVEPKWVRNYFGIISKLIV
jgi:hypothetical protein